MLVYGSDESGVDNVYLLLTNRIEKKVFFFCLQPSRLKSLVLNLILMYTTSIQTW